MLKVKSIRVWSDKTAPYLRAAALIRYKLTTIDIHVIGEGVSVYTARWHRNHHRKRSEVGTSPGGWPWVYRGLLGSNHHLRTALHDLVTVAKPEKARTATVFLFSTVEEMFDLLPVAALLQQGSAKGR